MEKGECSHCGPMSDSSVHKQETATGRKCGGAIRFRQLPNGKLAPINENDGEFHKQSCKVALWHRKGDPDISPSFVTNPINVTTYQGSTPPWEFPTWQWIAPADEAKKQRGLSKNGYLELPLAKAS